VINPLDSTSAAADADISPLIQQLVKRADANHDGKVTGAEFMNFLSGLLGSNSPIASTASTGATSTNPTGGTNSTTLPPCPPGWDPVKWSDLSHTTPKYVVGRIITQYPPTPQGLIDAMPQLQAAIPGLTQVGDDTLSIPGAGVVDVGLSFGAGGGVGWWWGPQDQV
jgi:hypothetical protein